MKRTFRRVVQRVARRLDLRIERRYGPDIDPGLRETIRAASGRARTSDAAIVALHDAVRYVESAGIPGALVECGVDAGGSLLVMARTLRELGVDRELVGFDTFAGMTAPSAEDVRYDGTPATAADALGLSRDEPPSVEAVRELVNSSGYPPERIRLVVGPVEQTLPGQAPDQIALLRLDTDWYESTRHELVWLYPRLVSGGILIIDDYGHWLGARQATDEYLAQLERSPFLHRVDHTVRLAVKP